MLLTIRDGEGAPLDLTGVAELTLRGLDRSAASELLERTSGTRPPAAVLERLLAATAGNPLALIELPPALGAEQLSGVEPLDEPLAVGNRLRESFVKRATELPPATQDALLLCAASSSERIEPVARAASAFGTSMEALEEAERAGLVELAADKLRFRHPLVRSAVYHAADHAQRRRAHAALAAAEAPGARRAWHLANAAVGPDEAVAKALEEAALDAQARAGAKRGERRGSLRARRLRRPSRTHRPAVGQRRRRPLPRPGAGRRTGR